jgi:hypothetical protein
LSGGTESHVGMFDPKNPGLGWSEILEDNVLISADFNDTGAYFLVSNPSRQTDERLAIVSAGSSEPKYHTFTIPNSTGWYDRGLAVIDREVFFKNGLSIFKYNLETKQLRALDLTKAPASSFAKVPTSWGFSKLKAPVSIQGRVLSAIGNLLVELLPDPSTEYLSKSKLGRGGDFVLLPLAMGPCVELSSRNCSGLDLLDSPLVRMNNNLIFGQSSLLPGGTSAWTAVRELLPNSQPSKQVK